MIWSGFGSWTRVASRVTLPLQPVGSATPSLSFLCGAMNRVCTSACDIALLWRAYIKQLSRMQRFGHVRAHSGHSPSAATRLHSQPRLQ